MYKSVVASRVARPDDPSWAAVVNIAGQKLSLMFPAQTTCLPSGTPSHKTLFKELSANAGAFATHAQHEVSAAAALGKQKDMSVLDALTKKHNIVKAAAQMVELLLDMSSEGTFKQ